eukprot:TRINITY_DN7840_c0_g1_i1.p1 TRINITY_DN7840_c0_g1~~TRINITY_DN7840_c0_g1_i1.p1  ORF type:complete len:498 (+),score=171.42 TRINITY_DN7840_c0_g1_i1:47-1495(+)
MAGKHDETLEQQMDDIFQQEQKSNLREQRRQPKVRQRQESEDFIRSDVSSKILKEARKQQQEIAAEEDEAEGLAAAKAAFAKAAEDISKGNLASASLGNDDDDDDENDGRDLDRDVDDEEELQGFSDSESQWGEIVGDVTEEDEKIMEKFMLAAAAAPQRTLGDIIMQKIQQKAAEAGVSMADADDEKRRIPGLNDKVNEVYQGVGKLLSRFKSGKVPKAFKILPSLSNWEEILWLTQPEAWSPNAMFAATRLFASNLNARMAQRFYALVLLPRVREDIRRQKRLHFALYQALKKAVYKPSAFFKGILLPLCQSGTCSLREAVIVGSIMQKVSIPAMHSAVALMKIADMRYSGTNSYFIKLLLDKKYALPYRVIDAVTRHFLRFMDDERSMPVIWHQALLSFVQRYKNEIEQKDREELKRLMKQQRHYLVTPEIQRELQNSHARGQKDTMMLDNMRKTTLVKGTTDEDIRSLPEVSLGMEED